MLVGRCGGMQNAGRLDGGYEPTGVDTMVARRGPVHTVPPYDFA